MQLLSKKGVGNQDRCWKSEQGIPNQDRVFEIRIRYSSTWAQVQKTTKCKSRFG